MRVTAQLLIRLIVFLATYLFIYWFPFALIPVDEKRWIPAIAALVCALLIERYVCKTLNSAPVGVTSYILLGAIMIGSISFCIGFFGPIIFTPQTNHGPMLGIFITCSSGFLIGGIGGYVYWMAKRRTPTSINTVRY